MISALRREDKGPERKEEDTDRTDNHVKIEAEIGAVQPQEKEHLEAPKLKEVRKKYP